VTQRNAATQRGTSCAARWFARTLLVVGGAVASTAAAWAVSTACASADIVQSADPVPESAAQHNTADREITPVTDATIGATDILGDASKLLGHTARAARRLRPGADSEDAARDGRAALHGFTRYAVLRPAGRVLAAVKQITREPAEAPRMIAGALTPSPGLLDLLGTTGNALITSALRPVHGDEPHLPAAKVTGPLGTAPQPVPPGPAVNAPAAGASHEESVDPASLDHGRQHHGDLPGQEPFAPRRAPLAPSGLPFAPAGAANGGHLDGPLLGLPAAALNVVSTSGPRAMRFPIRHTPVEPGSQPGVTPD
jgi:hypothetical protein